MPNESDVIKAVGYFNGHDSRGNFDVQLKAKFMADDLPNALQFVAGIGKQIRLVASVDDEKVKLGRFTVYSLRVDKDMNCFITFKSNVDSVYSDNFVKLMVEDAHIVFIAKVLKEDA